MKRAILILCILCTVSLAGYSPGERVLYIPAGTKINPFDRIFDAVAMVESNMNPNAYNKKENSVGIIQIREIRIKDFNNQTKSKYKLVEMYDPIKSKSVFMYYAKRIGHQYPEKIIRCWNGGENGMRYRQTKQYYQKVSLHLNKKLK